MTTWTVLVGSCLAETDDGSIDQAGIEFLELFVPQSETLHNSWSEVFRQHIHGFGQALDDFLALPRFHVDRNTAFVPVEVDKIWIFPFAYDPRYSGGVSIEGFRLDHIRPEICEQHGAERTGNHPGQIQDFDSC